MNNKEILGLHRITKKHLKELCKKHRLYQTPHLNDQLYLHFQGFQAIENLEEYTGLKCLWLESNAISEIQGLDKQGELKCLFLQNNLIKKIENLQFCPELDTLNLASNYITQIENCGIEVLPVLSTLNLSRNCLKNSVGLQDLINCKSLWSLDLSNNRIDDILVVKIFANMPELRVLVLQGNPVVSQVPQYRKTLILECKNLTYLDSRPVFPKDRACAEAWKRGGYEEERREHDRWVRMDRKKIRDSVNATLRLRQKHGAGDVQLLESTDDEEENPQPKKLKQILETEESAGIDLEIVGREQDNMPTKSDSSSMSTSTNTASSSANASQLNTDSDNEGNISKATKELGTNEEASSDYAIQAQTNENPLGNLEKEEINTQAVENEEGDIQMQTTLHEGEGHDNEQSARFGSVVMKSETIFSAHPTPYYESKSTGTSASSSSDLSSISESSFSDRDLSVNEKGILEPKDEELSAEVDLQTADALDEGDASEVGVDNESVKVDMTKLTRSSTYDLYSMESMRENNDFYPESHQLSSTEEVTVNSLKTDEELILQSEVINCQEPLHEDSQNQNQFSNLSEGENPSQPLEADQDLSPTSWSPSELNASLQEPLKETFCGGRSTTNDSQAMELSDEEDSGLFNSFQNASSNSEGQLTPMNDNLEKTSMLYDETEAIDCLESVLPEASDEDEKEEEKSSSKEDQEIVYNDPEVALWLESFLTALKKKEEQRTHKVAIEEWNILNEDEEEQTLDDKEGTLDNSLLAVREKVNEDMQIEGKTLLEKDEDETINHIEAWLDSNLMEVTDEADEGLQGVSIDEKYVVNENDGENLVDTEARLDSSPLAVTEKADEDVQAAPIEANTVVSEDEVETLVDTEAGLDGSIVAITEKTDEDIQEISIAEKTLVPEDENQTLVDSSLLIMTEKADEDVQAAPIEENIVVNEDEAATLVDTEARLDSSLVAITENADEDIQEISIAEKTIVPEDENQTLVDSSLSTITEKVNEDVQAAPIEANTVINEDEVETLVETEARLDRSLVAMTEKADEDIQEISIAEKTLVPEDENQTLVDSSLLTMTEKADEDVQAAPIEENIVVNEDEAVTLVDTEARLDSSLVAITEKADEDIQEISIAEKTLVPEDENQTLVDSSLSTITEKVNEDVQAAPIEANTVINEDEVETLVDTEARLDSSLVAMTENADKDIQEISIAEKTLVPENENQTLVNSSLLTMTEKADEDVQAAPIEENIGVNEDEAATLVDTEARLDSSLVAITENADEDIQEISIAEKTIVPEDENQTLVDSSLLTITEKADEDVQAAPIEENIVVNEDEAVTLVDTEARLDSSLVAITEKADEDIQEISIAEKTLVPEDENQTLFDSSLLTITEKADEDVQAAPIEENIVVNEDEAVTLVDTEARLDSSLVAMKEKADEDIQEISIAEKTLVPEDENQTLVDSSLLTITKKAVEDVQVAPIDVKTVVNEDEANTLVDTSVNEKELVWLGSTLPTITEKANECEVREDIQNACPKKVETELLTVSKDDNEEMIIQPIGVGTCSFTALDERLEGQNKADGERSEEQATFASLELEHILATNEVNESSEPCLEEPNEKSQDDEVTDEKFEGSSWLKEILVSLRNNKDEPVTTTESSDLCEAPNGDLLTSAEGKTLEDQTSENKSEPSIPLERTLATLKQSSHNKSQPGSWWQKTLAAAQIEAPPLLTESEDTPPQFEPNFSENQTLEDKVEAFSLLETILAETYTTKIENNPIQPEANELIPTNEDTQSKNSSTDDSYNDEPTVIPTDPTPTLREVLTSFNAAMDTIILRNKERSMRIRDLIANPMTKELSSQNADRLNQQFEEMKREKHTKVSQIVDQVYAQKDKYDDTLEVVDGRLMVVKRSTGDLEEIPPPPPSKYTSCGVSTSQTKWNDSDSDEYRTALSENEPDDHSDIEQHTSDTRIKNISYLRAGGCSGSISSSQESLEDTDYNQTQFDSRQRAEQLHKDIDARILSVVDKWMEGDVEIPTVEPPVQKQIGREEVMLMRQRDLSELQAELDSQIRPAIGFDEAGLEDIALMFEVPE